MSVRINGKTHRTITDAAQHFGVSSKTVKSWIRKQIVPEPPEERIGLRRFQVFPEAWIKEAQAALDRRIGKTHRE